MTRVIVLREWLRFRRAMGRMGMIRFLGVYLAVFGLLVPGAFGDPSSAIVMFAVVPLYAAGPMAVDAFAGERERMTLETLLSSPVTPRELLRGKALFPVMLSLATTWSALLLFTVMTLLRGGTMPAPGAYGTVVLAGFFTAVIGSLAGLHTSLRVPTVRTGQQWFSVVLIVIVLGVPLFLKVLLPLLPPALLGTFERLFSGGWTSPGALLLTALLLLVCYVLWVTLSRRMRGLWRLNPERGLPG